MSDTSRLSAALAGHYTIEREIGAGGMATVYLARDVRHDREVALKVLRPELAAVLGAQRFLAEIKITARLDHPHILTLIDSGESDGLLWYVLPFIRGESLRDRLARETQLSLDESVTITRQVAAALDYAHRQGVVHRDIKPENILLHEGEAVLADFGIALAVREAGGNRLTETGLSLGTPQYMSPEQATGDRQLDARSDVYSLGAVLYEMLAGEPPVTGPTVQSVIAKLMTERPIPLRRVRDTVPEEMDAAVLKALARTPADRFASAGEFAAALSAARTAPPPRDRQWSRRPGYLVASGVAVLLLVVGAVMLARRPAPSLAIGRSEQLTADPGLEIQPAISPDGKLVAYSAGNSMRMRVYIRPVGGGRTIPLSDDSGSVETDARWSPDGSRILFLTRGGVSVAPSLGGSSRPLVPPSATAPVVAATWSPDGAEIAFVRGDSLLVAEVAGGQTRLVWAGAFDPHSCDWSPDGKWIACVQGNGASTRPGSQFGNLAPSAVALFPAKGGAPQRLLEPGAFNESPVWSRGGSQLLFVSNRDGPKDIYVLSLSSSGRPRGEPSRLTTGLGTISISLSADGRRLAYAVYSARANIWALPVPTGPAVTPSGAAQVTSGNQIIESMRVSWDGRWLLYDSNLKGNADIYRVPIGGGQPEQLTSDPADEFAPDLSPDGKAVAYHSFRLGTRDIEAKPLDGGPREQVTATPAQESYPRWSPDGRAILFLDQAGPGAVFVTRRGAAGQWLTPERLTSLASSASHAEWSPDGREIAFVSGDSVQPGAWLVVMPAARGPARRVFEPGAGIPAAEAVQWSPDGRTLYYKAHDALGRASIWGVSAAGGRPRQLVRFDDPNWQSNRPDFATDGKRFYFTVEDRQSDIYVAELVGK